jgi:hypothetical protein
LAILPESANAADIMTIMKSVSADPGTMWTSVYDLSANEFSIVYRRQFAEVFRDRLPPRE